MSLDSSVVRSLSTRLYLVAASLYAVSIVTRSVLMTLAWSPALSRFSAPLAGFLQFLVTEIQALTVPPVATVCLVAAFILRPTLTTILAQRENPRGVPSAESFDD